MHISSNISTDQSLNQIFFHSLESFPKTNNHFNYLPNARKLFWKNNRTKPKKKNSNWNDITTI